MLGSTVLSSRATASLPGTNQASGLRTTGSATRGMLCTWREHGALCSVTGVPVTWWMPKRCLSQEERARVIVWGEFPEEAVLAWATTIPRHQIFYFLVIFVVSLASDCFSSVHHSSSRTADTSSLILSDFPLGFHLSYQARNCSPLIILYSIFNRKCMSLIIVSKVHLSLTFANFCLVLFFLTFFFWKKALVKYKLHGLTKLIMLLT